MFVLIILLLILSISFGIKVRIKVKEEEAILISLFGMILFTYILGLINLLKIAIYIVPIFAIICLSYVIYKIVKKQEKIQEIITLPTIIYCILMFVIYFVVKDINFHEYDEFMFWGTNLKVIVTQDVLWANAQVDGIHLVYPPFTAVTEYIMCKYNGAFNEGVAYFGMGALMLTILMPLLKNERYSIKSFFKIVLTILSAYILVILFGFNITNLSVDCILGMMLGISSYLAYNLKDKKDYITLGIMLIGTTLMKTNGILIAGIVIMQLFFQITFRLIVDKNKDILKEYITVIMLLIIVISTLGGWTIYYKVNGKQIDDRHDKNYPEKIDIVEFINAMTLNEEADTRNKNILTGFITKSIEQPITISESYNTTFWIFEAINVIYIILILTSQNRKKLFANILSLDVGFFLYVIQMLIIYMFVFQEIQGRFLDCFDRYIQTYMIAMMLNLVYLVTYEYNIKKIISMGIFIIIISKDINIQNVKLRNYEMDSYIYNSGLEINEKILQNEKVFIIDQNLDAGIRFVQIRYLISPIQTNLLYEWNITTEPTKIYYKLQISEDELINKLIEEQYDYIYIISVDEEFLKEYENIISNEVKQELEQYIISKDLIINKENGILLKIDKEQRKIVL